MCGRYLMGDRIEVGEYTGNYFSNEVEEDQRLVLRLLTHRPGSQTVPIPPNE